MAVKRISGRAIMLIIASAFLCCSRQDSGARPEDSADAPGTYAYDRTFLEKYEAGLIELTTDGGRSRLLVSTKYQGRVMTSTADGDAGTSFGWVNYELIRSGVVQKQFNPVGGEERFWIGPEGGQFSFYFSPGDSFDISNWQVPYLIDTVSYERVYFDSASVAYEKESTLTNYSGTEFLLKVKRRIRLLDGVVLKEKTGIDFQGLHVVAYETNNEIRNMGEAPWTKEKGLPSIWLLCMMKPSDETVVFIPYKPLPGADRLITDNYFGEVPVNRLIRRDSILLLKCDGNYRSKVGLSPVVSKGSAASYDFSRNILSVIFFPVDSAGLYVNSKWEIQDVPYQGDVVNAYNDGPLADGSQLGPFYELESSSPAKELRPGQAVQHSQVMVHVQGGYQEMNSLMNELFGMDLNDIRMNSK